MVALGILIKIRVLFLLVLVDLLCNAISPTVQKPIYVNGVLIGLHVSSVVLQASVLYSMISRTVMFRAGLYTGVLKYILPSSIVGVLHLAFLVATYSLRFYAIARKGFSAFAWNLPYYWVLFFFQQTISVVHYVSIMRSGVRLCEGRLYLTSTRSPTKE